MGKHHETLNPVVRGQAELAMSDTARVVLIALGVALVVVILVPALFMGVMMGGGMMGYMMNGGMMGGFAWLVLGLVLVILVAGVALLVAGLRR
jgi:hypothetical protein